MTLYRPFTFTFRGHPSLHASFFLARCHRVFCATKSSVSIFIKCVVTIWIDSAKKTDEHPQLITTEKKLDVYVNVGPIFFSNFEI
jgi:hypothetical protein